MGFCTCLQIKAREKAAAVFGVTNPPQIPLYTPWTKGDSQGMGFWNHPQPWWDFFPFDQRGQRGFVIFGGDASRTQKQPEGAGVDTGAAKTRLSLSSLPGPDQEVRSGKIRRAEPASPNSLNGPQPGLASVEYSQTIAMPDTSAVSYTFSGWEMDKQQTCKRCSLVRVNALCSLYEKAFEAQEATSLNNLKNLVTLAQQRGFANGRKILRPGLRKSEVRTLAWNISSLLYNDDLRHLGINLNGRGLP